MKNLIYFLAALLTLAMYGCGGSGGGAASGGRGTLSLKIKWPTPTRLIPVASLSIEAVLTDSQNNPLGTQIVARPTSGNTSTVNFPDLPAGNVTLTATAYPTTNGAGTGVVAQAKGASTAAITAGQTSAVTVTMADTITHTQLVATGGGTAGGPLATGATQQLSLTSFDALNEVVLTSPTTITYTVASGNAFGSISSSGLATMLASGSTPESFSVTGTETESGVTSPAVVYNYTPVILAKFPATAVTDSTGSHLYVLMNAAIHVFNIDPSTGKLTFSQEIAAPGVNTRDENFYAMVLAGGNLYAYANDTANILAYTINPSDGTLTSAGAPIAGPSGALSLATDPQGKFIYAGGQVSGSTALNVYSINSDGSLTLGSTITSLGGNLKVPFNVGLVPTTSFMIGACRDTSNFDHLLTMTVNSDGTLTVVNNLAVSGSGTAYGPYTFNPNGTSFYTTAEEVNAWTISSSGVTSAGGFVLTPTATDHPAAVVTSTGILFDRAYTGEAGAPTDPSTINGFTVSGGNLTGEVTNANALSGENIGVLVVTPNAQFLYTTNTNDDSISQYSVSGKTLTPLSPAKVTS